MTSGGNNLNYFLANRTSLMLQFLPHAKIFQSPKGAGGHDPSGLMVNTPMIRPTHSCARALTYLHSWLGAYETGNIPEMVEDRAKFTINYGLYKVVHGLSIVAKMDDL